MPVGMGLVAEREAAREVAREVAGKAVAVMAVVTVEEMEAAVMVEAAMAEGTAAVAMAAAGTVEETEAAERAEVVTAAEMVAEGMVEAMAGCQKPRPHNTERPNAHRPRGNQISCGCCP